MSSTPCHNFPLTMASYLSTLQDALGLRDWRIVLVDEPTPEAAFITPVPGQKLAHLQVNAAFWSETPEEQRHTLVHELLHLHVHETQACVDRSSTLLGVAGAVLSTEHRNFLEHGVDAVAGVLAPFLPLPPEDS